MPDQEIGPPEDERLLDLAVAIADGTPINWATGAPTDSAAEANSVVMRLQCLERLVRGHEAMRSPSSERSAAARETVLTEAHRKAKGILDQPLRVQWGPLIVLEKIGRGSFGDVYRAWDPRLDREVALKLIPENASDTASPVVEEGRLLARVRHPNVLTVHGAERIDGRVGIWTEYVRGETLAAEIDRRGPVSAVEAARIGIEICRALVAVHGAGLLHRDVKAQNILRDSTGRIVLGDFGTGIEIDEHAGITEPQIAGTPLYLAPEIFEHRPATVGSDLYSVGVLLYVLVTGNYPVRGRTLAEIRKAHATGERVPLRATHVGLPEQFVDVVEALLKPEPEGRFQTATAVEAALAESMRGDDESRGSASAGRRRWLPSLTLAAVIVLIASAALALALSQRQSRAEVRAATAHQQSDAPVVVQQGPPPPLAPTPAETATAPPPVSTRLNAGDWILVASFDNQTGEAVLDGTIEAALKRE
ncbi:MAG TPA: serine/threonine-protein kinase, partial [Vicinamibacterales bacterium]